MWGLKLASGAHRRLHSPLAHHSRQALAWYYPGLCKRTVSGVWKPVEIPSKKSRETIMQRTWRTTQCIHRSVNHSGSKTSPGKHPTGGHVSHPTAVVHYIYVTLGSYRYITISDYIIRLKCQWYCMNASTHHRGKLTILAVFIYLNDTSIAATHRFFYHPSWYRAIVLLLQCISEHDQSTEAIYVFQCTFQHTHSAHNTISISYPYGAPCKSHTQTIHLWTKNIVYFVHAKAWLRHCSQRYNLRTGLGVHFRHTLFKKSAQLLCSWLP